MTAHKRRKLLNRFIDDVKGRQENLLWPNTLVNSKNVDRLLFKGSPNPTLVQRIGAWLFGLLYIGLGFCFVSFAKHDSENSFVWWTIAAFLIALGVLVCYNGSRKAER